MTDDLLTETLHHRADRADTAPDVEQLLAKVQDLAEWRQRRRRTAVAATSGVGLIAALVAGIVMLGPGSGPSVDTHQQVGGQPSRTQSNPAPSSTGPSVPYLGPVRTTPAVPGPMVTQPGSVTPAAPTAGGSSVRSAASTAAGSSVLSATPTGSNAASSSDVRSTAVRPTTSATP